MFFNNDLAVMKESSKKNILLELSNRVKLLRKERNLTQEDCFNDTGIHFARIEQGKRDISYTTLYKICEYFDISLQDFFNDLK